MCDSPFCSVIDNLQINLFFADRFGSLLLQIALNEIVDIAVHDSLNIALFNIGAMLYG